MNPAIVQGSAQKEKGETARETLDHTLKSLTDASQQAFKIHPVSRLPSVEKLKHIVGMIRALLFPGYFGECMADPSTLTFFMGKNLAEIFDQLTEQIQNTISFDEDTAPEQSRNRAAEISLEFIKRIPEIRRIVTTDAHSIYEADPAARSASEVVFCYPAIKAIINHRVAHELRKLGVPLIPRIISEFAHSETGIDIHPGAQIGEFFCIDHGTGVVIGETCIIGSNVRLYQGVTLGAKKFTLDEHGNPIKDELRHPIIEDGVTIYSNATILGRIRIGANSIIGGNVWITNDLPPDSRITQAKSVVDRFEDGSGI